MPRRELRYPASVQALLERVNYLADLPIAQFCVHRECQLVGGRIVRFGQLRLPIPVERKPVHGWVVDARLYPQPVYLLPETIPLAREAISQENRHDVVR